MSASLHIQYFEPYFRYCSSACERLRRLESEHRDYCEKYPTDPIPNLQHASRMREQVDRIRSLRLHAPLYGVMALEQLINSYAATRYFDLPHTVASLEKLSLVSKLAVIPAIVCNREIDLQSEEINRLNTLISTRNFFTHPKVEYRAEIDGDSITKFGQRIEARSSTRDEAARMADETISSVATLLACVDTSGELIRIAQMQGVRLKT